MKIKIKFNPTIRKFIVFEDELLYEIPFGVIFSKGRKLVYYSDVDSKTPVKDWFDQLDDHYKTEIIVKMVH